MMPFIPLVLALGALGVLIYLLATGQTSEQKLFRAIEDALSKSEENNAK